ncbi:methyltransferase domain-containing protein [Streptomyces sp. NPDC057555]|uniref:methyltransferase domain-containing protein n=1 Tax=Streptomyces sp. NPDC057555 TaxID=3346166 RepID=UPI0036860BA7
MSPTLVRHQLPNTGSVRCTAPDAPAGTRARDWAEIQEPMLVPLYEAAYDRLGVGPGTRLLGLGCGSGLALLLAAARGAQVSGVDADECRLELARRRLTPDGMPEVTRLVSGGLADAAPQGAAFTVITAFHPAGCGGGVQEPAGALTAAAAMAERGSAVVLGGWGPMERCAAAGVLGVARRLADPSAGLGAGWQPAGRDDLEELAGRAGLRPDGSGRVACPFGYADMAGAVRGMLSTGLFDAALEAAGPRQVEKELAKALRPYRRADGTVWMANVFRYLIARTR